PFSFLITRRPPRSPLFPYTTLFRSGDNLVVTAPIGLFFGRCANFINGELYGRITNVPWAMQFPKELLDHPQEAERAVAACAQIRSEEHTSELQSRENLVCRLLLEKK